MLISLEDALLRRVDRVARARGLTRSAYLAGLAEQDVLRALGPGTSPSVRRALSGLDELFVGAPASADATEAVRAERDAR